jgi:hypothetical protein
LQAGICGCCAASGDPLGIVAFHRRAALQLRPDEPHVRLAAHGPLLPRFVFAEPINDAQRDPAGDREPDADSVANAVSHSEPGAVTEQYGNIQLYAKPFAIAVEESTGHGKPDRKPKPDAVVKPIRDSNTEFNAESDTFSVANTELDGDC